MGGYLDVWAEDDDTLTVRRYAVDGLDAFGHPLDEPEARVTITRKAEPAAGGSAG